MERNTRRSLLKIPRFGFGGYSGKRLHSSQISRSLPDPSATSRRRRRRGSVKVRPFGESNDLCVTSVTFSGRVGPRQRLPGRHQHREDMSVTNRAGELRRQVDVLMESEPCRTRIQADRRTNGHTGRGGECKYSPGFTVSGSTPLRHPLTAQKLSVWQLSTKVLRSGNNRGFFFFPPALSGSRDKRDSQAGQNVFRGPRRLCFARLNGSADGHGADLPLTQRK